MNKISIATTTTTIKRQQRQRHPKTTNDDHGTTSHVQLPMAATGKRAPQWSIRPSLHAKTEFDENRREIQRPADVKFLQASDESPDVSFVKAAAEEACSGPSFLKVAPVSCNGAQRPICHGSKTLAPTPSNEPEAIAVSLDPGPLSSGSVVEPIPEIMERSSLTPALVDLDQSSTSSSFEDPCSS